MTDQVWLDEPTDNVPGCEISTNACTAIQTISGDLYVATGNLATDFAAAQAGGYSGVVIPQGNYSFSSPILITQDNFKVSVIGAPILTYTGTGYAIIVGATGDTISGVDISGIELHYDGSANSRAGLLAYTPRGMYLRNVTIEDTRSSSGATTSVGFKIYTDGATNAADVVWENCYTDGCYYGIWLTGTQKVNGCRVTGGQYKGYNAEAGSRSIYIQNGQHNLFEHCTCNWSETGLYIGVDDASYDTGGQVLLHAHFEDDTTGVYVGAGSNGHVGLIKKVGSVVLLSDNGDYSFWLQVPVDYIGLGGTTQNLFSRVILETDTGCGMLFKNGSGYAQYGGTNVLTLYNLSGPINLCPNNLQYALFIDTLGNAIIGALVAGATAQKTLALSNAATEPTTSTDLVHIYAKDRAAGAAALSVYQEAPVEDTVDIAVTKLVPVRINGINYKLFAIVG